MKIMKNNFYTALLLGTSAIVLNIGILSEAWAGEGYCEIAPEDKTKSIALMKTVL